MNSQANTLPKPKTKSQAKSKSKIKPIPKKRFRAKSKSKIHPIPNSQAKPKAKSAPVKLLSSDYTVDELLKMASSKNKKVSEFAKKSLHELFVQKAKTGPETKNNKNQRKIKVFKISLQENDQVFDNGVRLQKHLPKHVLPKNVKLMPTSGYEPRFIKLWGSRKQFIEANNCYAYAANQFRFWRPHKAQPGENRLKIHNNSRYIPLKCGDITQAVLRDAGNGAYKCNDPNKACEKGLTKIMMVISPEPGSQDFHFYRQDKDGTWSHKQGWGYGPTKLDASGKVIVDPRTCNRNYGRLNYSKVCSTMCIPKQFKYNI